MSKTAQFPNLQSNDTPKVYQKLQGQVMQDIEIKTFSLQNQNSNTFQLFSMIFTHGWIQRKLTYNLYSLFERIGTVGMMRFRILDPQKCQLKQIVKIEWKMAEKQCFVSDNEFWQIVTKSFGIVTIKYSVPSNNFLSFIQETQVSNQIEEKTKQSKIISSKEKASSENEVDMKGKRSGERTIQEVILLVQKWRKYETSNPQRMKKLKKVSLVQAANLVGVSKKTLDDYYYQLRTGEKLGFDFMSHLDLKIGALRNFIKIKFPKRKTGEKNGKHGKNLCIIENFRHPDSPMLHILHQNQNIDKTQQKTTSIEQDSLFDAQASLTLDNLFYDLSDNDLEDCIHVDVVDSDMECMNELLL